MIFRFALLMILAWCTAAGAVDRPASTPAGVPFVMGSQVYTADGQLKLMHGFNRVHWDSYGSPTGMPLSGANTVRVAVDMNQSQATNWGVVDPLVAAGIMPIIGTWSTTCKSDTASLTSAVDKWVAQVSTWTRYSGVAGINIGNEWGPADSIVWRDSYIAAIQRMRLAGYNGLLVIDSGGCGQDAKDIIKYGAAVLASDPQRNLLFDVHVYGGFSFPATVPWQNDYTKSMQALKDTGLPIVIGEFGPGKRIGPSPTLITPEQVIATAEANGWGWLAWGWDDNNLKLCAADDSWFSMTTKCGKYTGNDATELTAFGKIVVPILKARAASAAAR